MAERLLRHVAGDHFEAYSAGTEQTRVHPLAVRAMQEIGVDISQQRSKTLDCYLADSFDYVITVCDRPTSNVVFFRAIRNASTGVLPIPPQPSGMSRNK